MIRPLILPVVLAALMSGIFFLPTSGTVAESAISLKLPAGMDDWDFNIIQASQKEVDILAKDTDFSKAVCVAPVPNAYTNQGDPIDQRVDLSIVLSGSDINNSIHRPERCMPAQGHQIYEAKSDVLTTPGGRTLPVRELASVQNLPLDEKGEKSVSFHCVTYYFFVGQNEITEDHLKRTLIDMRDRVLHGQDQRWAYVSVSMWFSEEGKSNGFRDPSGRAVVFPSREDAEKKIRQFLGKLADRNINWQQIASR
ncbi:exosortase-associated EpsI family protein [Luteolibacter ambystomatis]|uniref:Exosortase-associated EpsI family protein n=1 Tax=Luteolibacter ambystomatis TaxID=2824561 RepID=A0A975IYJ5_9BACT|nr:exosortase-associated EpsI family protein [Luteolibacter ambystomatis]QUE50204.1 exosortase-associated EpsI family protein [Luteolibacter ambystomatis]